MRGGITLIKMLWTEEGTSFQVEFYVAKEAIYNPKPVQKPHPPIMIEGGGKKYTRKAATEIGDMWDRSGASIEDIYKESAYSS